MSAFPSILAGKRILLILSGGVAAYKILELIRRLRERGVELRVILTPAATQFVTPLTVAALSGQKVQTDLFSLTDEAEMGHIQLSRWADAILAAPATADLLAKASHGLSDDLASTLLLATDKKPIFVPAMNIRMWTHPATQRNIARLLEDGAEIWGPAEGAMACGEFGPGRMIEPMEILDRLETYFKPASMLPLKGRRAVVTAGPTREPIDPVRFLTNRSSGKQGYAIAQALAQAGAEVILVSGPVALSAPKQDYRPMRLQIVQVETACEMLAAVEAALPADIFVAAAAVADWRMADYAQSKTKKGANGPPTLHLVENPDILALVAQAPTHRPKLVIGFAAETENLLENAQKKLHRKGCDFIAANYVGADSGVFDGDDNRIMLVARDGATQWPSMTKEAAAQKLTALIADYFDERTGA